MKGWIERRGENSYRLNVSCGTKDGKQIKKRRAVHVTGKTDAEKKKEAEKLLAEFMVEIERGLVIDGKKSTFKEFVETWLREYAEVELAPKTVFRYKEILNSRILPSLGHIKLDQLRPQHIIEFEAMLRQDGIRQDGKPGGLSRRTILQHHRIMSSILNDAMQWQLIYSNPVARVKPPKIEKKQAACYDEEQMLDLLDAMELAPLKYRVMVDLAIGTGLRRGEIMGLEWPALDLDKCTLEVCQASQYLPGQGTFTKGPKNETSKRLIAVPANTIALLKKWKAQQNEQRLRVGDLWRTKNEEGMEENWVFTTWDGHRMHPDTISKWFPEFIKKVAIHKACNSFMQKDYCPNCDKKVPEDEIIRLPKLNFHGLRHTSLTLLIAEGVDLREVSGRAGHANMSTTGDIYAHFLKKADQSAAEKLDNLMTKRKKKQDGKQISSK
jgi:integrase